MSKKRKSYLDILRVIACVAVVYIHSGRIGHFYFASFPFESWQHRLLAVPAVVSKMAVPLFLMISGAVLLDRQEDWKTHYKKRLPRGFALILFANLFYWFSEWFLFRREISLLTFIQRTMGGGMKYHLWYLYLYVAFLLVVPFLRVLVQQLSDALLVLFLVFGLLERARPLVEFLIVGQEMVAYHLRLGWIATEAVLFPCLGYYLAHRIPQPKLKGWMVGGLLLAFIGVILAVEGMRLDMVRLQQFGEEYPGTYFECVDGWFAIAIFLVVRVVTEHRELSKRTQSILQFLGEQTLGIYIFHIFWNNVYWTYQQYLNWMQAGVPHLLAIVGYLLLLIVPSMGMTVLLQQLPGFHWLLGGKQFLKKHGEVVG